MKKYIVRALVPAAGVILLVNMFLGGWVEPDPHRRIERALASGFDHHLVKPANIDRLRQLLADLK